MDKIEIFGHKLERKSGDSLHPFTGGMRTNVVRTWWRLDEGEWFLPKENIITILQNIFSCKNEEELLNYINSINGHRL